MIEKITKFYVRRDVCSDKIEFRGFQKIMGDAFVYTDIKLELHKQGDYTSPFMSLYPEEAQQLMNEMYDAGLRPSQSAGSAGQLDAVKYHLEDMRKLVFSK